MNRAVLLEVIGAILVAIAAGAYDVRLAVGAVGVYFVYAAREM